MPTAPLTGRASDRRSVDLWAKGQPAFGVYAPRPYTIETAEKLAGNPLYDFIFLNLEGGYDAAAVKAIAEPDCAVRLRPDARRFS